MGLHRVAYMGLYRAFWGECFEDFFRSLSTRDGFLTLPNDDLAGFTPGTCVFALIFMLFNPFTAGRRLLFFMAL